MAGGNIMSRWSGEIHPNGEVALSDPAWAQAISIGKVQLNNKISKMEEVLANPFCHWEAPSPPFFFIRGHWECRSGMWRNPSQAAISLDTGDGWTAAKRRVMLMFVLIIKWMKIEYINMSIDMWHVFFFTICWAIETSKQFYAFWVCVKYIFIHIALCVCTKSYTICRDTVHAETVAWNVLYYFIYLIHKLKIHMR